MLPLAAGGAELVGVTGVAGVLEDGSAGGAGAGAGAGAGVDEGPSVVVMGASGLAGGGDSTFAGAAEDEAAALLELLGLSWHLAVDDRFLKRLAFCFGTSSTREAGTTGPDWEEATRAARP